MQIDTREFMSKATDEISSIKTDPGTIANISNLFRPIGSYFETSDTNFDPNTEWGGIWVSESYSYLESIGKKNASGNIGITNGSYTTLATSVPSGNTFLAWGMKGATDTWCGAVYTPDETSTSARFFTGSYWPNSGTNATHGQYFYYKKVTRNRWRRVPMKVTLNHHGSWVDSGTTVDGHKVYKSNGSYNTANAWDTAKIEFEGYSSFTVYVRSYAEGNYDYILVSQLNDDYLAERTSTSSMRSVYSNTTYTKAYTRAKQSSTTYTEVNFSDLDPTETYYFYIIYQKDSSANSNDDRGYFYIAV